MVIQIKQTHGRVELEEADIIPFSTLPINAAANATESQLEAMIAANIEMFVGSSEDDENHTLLVIGRQVYTKSNRRMDLVAVDGTGALTLIEVKRDASDTQSRADLTEIQAVRYAASLGRLRSVDDLVGSLYAKYIELFEIDDLRQNGGDRSAEEWARKKLTEFIRVNGIDSARLNHTQNIVLIGASFDRDTISASAWMAKNGLPIRVIQVEPQHLGGQYYLHIRELIPVPAYEDFYVDVTMSSAATKSTSDVVRDSPITRTTRIRLPALVEAGKVRIGDELICRIDPTRRAILRSDRTCEFEGSEVSLLQWTKQVTGWTAVNIYDWVIHQPTQKKLEDLRVELEEEIDARGT